MGWLKRSNKEEISTSDSSKPKGKEKRLSRRKFLTKATIGTAVTLVAVATNTDKEAVNLTAKGGLNAVEAYTRGRKVDTSGLDDSVEVADGDTLVVLGNSNTTKLGKKDGKDLATRTRDEARRRGTQVEAVSGGVPGSLARDLPKQARNVAAKIPPGADVHADFWAGENEDLAVQGLPTTLRRLSKNPGNIALWIDFFRKRGQAIDSLRRDLQEGTDKALSELERGGHKVKSHRQYGGSPVYRAPDLQQIVPGRTEPFTIKVEGDTLQEQATRIVLEDWTYQVSQAAADTAKAVKKQRGIPTTFQDPGPDVHEDNFSQEFAEHFDDQAGDNIARRTVGSWRKKSKKKKNS